jgi:hypothetical protein
MKMTLILALLLFSGMVYGQSSINSQVIAAAGNSGNTNTTVINYTLGEPVTDQYASNTVILSQGFQQPEGAGSVALEDVQNLMDLLIFPNPSSGEISIAFDTRKKLDLNIKLVDISGRVVRDLGDRVSVSGKETLHMDLTDLSSGVYFLRLLNPANGIQESIQVRKID